MGGPKAFFSIGKIISYVLNRGNNFISASVLRLSLHVTVLLHFLQTFEVAKFENKIRIEKHLT